MYGEECRELLRMLILRFKRLKKSEAVRIGKRESGHRNLLSSHSKLACAAITIVGFRCSWLQAWRKNARPKKPTVKLVRGLHATCISLSSSGRSHCKAVKIIICQLGQVAILPINRYRRVKYEILFSKLSFCYQVLGRWRRGWASCVNASSAVYLQSWIKIICAWRRICVCCHRSHGKFNPFTPAISILILLTVCHTLPIILVLGIWC